MLLSSPLRCSLIQWLYECILIIPSFTELLHHISENSEINTTIFPLKTKLDISTQQKNWDNLFIPSTNCINDVIVNGAWRKQFQLLPPKKSLLSKSLLYTSDIIVQLASELKQKLSVENPDITFPICQYFFSVILECIMYIYPCIMYNKSKSDESCPKHFTLCKSSIKQCLSMINQPFALKESIIISYKEHLTGEKLQLIKKAINSQNAFQINDCSLIQSIIEPSQRSQMVINLSLTILPHHEPQTKTQNFIFCCDEYYNERKVSVEQLQPEVDINQADVGLASFLSAHNINDILEVYSWIFVENFYDVVLFCQLYPQCKYDYTAVTNQYSKILTFVYDYINSRHQPTTINIDILSQLITHFDLLCDIMLYFLTKSTIITSKMNLIRSSKKLFYFEHDNNGLPSYNQIKSPQIHNEIVSDLSTFVVSVILPNMLTSIQSQIQKQNHNNTNDEKSPIVQISSIFIATFTNKFNISINKDLLVSLQSFSSLQSEQLSSFNLFCQNLFSHYVSTQNGYLDYDGYLSRQLSCQDINDTNDNNNDVSHISKHAALHNTTSHDGNAQQQTANLVIPNPSHRQQQSHNYLHQTSNILHNAPLFALTSLGTVLSCFRHKFGIPRQPTLVEHSKAIIQIRQDCLDSKKVLEGLETYSHLWVIFIFHQNYNGFIDDQPLYMKENNNNNNNIILYNGKDKLYSNQQIELLHNANNTNMDDINDRNDKNTPLYNISKNNVCKNTIKKISEHGPQKPMKRKLDNSQAPPDIILLSNPREQIRPPKRQQSAINRHTGSSDFDQNTMTKKNAPKTQGFASTRAPFRFNSIGQSLVKITHVDHVLGQIHISGHDLLHWTPVLDIKPLHLSDIPFFQHTVFPSWVYTAWKQHLPNNGSLSTNPYMIPVPQSTNELTVTNSDVLNNTAYCYQKDSLSKAQLTTLLQKRQFFPFFCTSWANVSWDLTPLLFLQFLVLWHTFSIFPQLQQYLKLKQNNIDEQNKKQLTLDLYKVLLAPNQPQDIISTEFLTSDFIFPKLKPSTIGLFSFYFQPLSLLKDFPQIQTNNLVLTDEIYKALIDSVCLEFFSLLDTISRCIALDPRSHHAIVKGDGDGLFCIHIDNIVVSFYLQTVHEPIVSPCNNDTSNGIVSQTKTVEKLIAQVVHIQYFPFTDSTLQSSAYTNRQILQNNYNIEPPQLSPLYICFRSFLYHLGWQKCISSMLHDEIKLDQNVLTNCNNFDSDGYNNILLQTIQNVYIHCESNNWLMHSLVRASSYDQSQLRSVDWLSALLHHCCPDIQENFGYKVDNLR